jgi:hypothetical protein
MTVSRKAMPLAAVLLAAAPAYAEDMHPPPAAPPNPTATGSMPGEMGMPMMGQEAQSRTLPEWLAQHEKMMSLELESLRRLKSAVDPLYAVLSDEQRKTADALARPMGMMGIMGMM